MKKVPISMRQFDTGATRQSDAGKLDYEGFESPLVVHAYAEYLHKHRRQADGNMRGSDNWQLGIDPVIYIKSAWRHLLDWWALHRGYFVYRERVDGKEKTHIKLKALDIIPENWEAVTKKDAICGVLFNAKGYLFELIKAEGKEE